MLLNVNEPVQRCCRSFLAVCLPLIFCSLDHLVLQHLPDHRKLSISQQSAKQRNDLLTFQGAVLV